MSNLRAETLAVLECQKGQVGPLLTILEAQLAHKELAFLICQIVTQRPAGKTAKRDQVGCQADILIRRRPQEKQHAIYDALAARHGLKARTVRHYHEHFLKTSKKVRPLLDHIREIDAQERAHEDLIAAP